MEPTLSLVQEAEFPLLCVYRTGEPAFDHVTIEEERITQDWGIDYILGPLDVDDIPKLGDICGAVGKAVRLVIRQRGHKSYENGALQFYPDQGGFATIQLLSQLGPRQASFPDDESETLYFSVNFRVRTTETSNDDLGAFGPLEAIDYSLGVGDSDEIIPDLVQADSSVPLEQG